MHHYYHLVGKTDLDKIKEDAQLRLDGKWIYERGGPEASIIHLHPKYVGDVEFGEVDCTWHDHINYELEK